MTARNKATKNPSLWGDGWKGGSAKAAVKGYVTRTGKKVKAHTRRVAGRQAKEASNQLLGRTVTRAITGKPEHGSFLRRLANEILMNVQRNAQKKRKGGRR